MCSTVCTRIEPSPIVVARSTVFRFAMVAAFVVALVFFAAGLKAATFQVDVGPNGSMSYSPQQTSITVGDTVEWHWLSASHSVTSTSGSELNSGLHNTGFVYSHTFMSTGT